MDPQARTCIGCGRVIERAATAPAESAKVYAGLGPTAAGAWLVLAILLVIVVGGPIFWWRSQYAQVPKSETELQQKARLQAESEGEMLKECTNVIVGLNRIIRSSVTATDENPYRWTGEATLEFVNRVGGVERTNLFFRFGTDTGPDGQMHLRCGTESESDRRNRQRGERREAGHFVDRRQ